MKKNVRVNIVPWFCLILLLFILSSCKTQDKNNILILNGESDNWKLTGFEVEITPRKFKVGNGDIRMKNHSEYTSNFFQYSTHVVLNNKDIKVHGGSELGNGMNIVERRIGYMEVESYLNDKGASATLEDISDIYMIVEWRDKTKNENVKERLDLYKTHNED